MVSFTRPDGGIILARAATGAASADISAQFPVKPGTVPSRWDGSPLVRRELTPPLQEASEPTGLRFGSPESAPRAAARIAVTPGCRLEQEGEV